jgi:hypothetical protein
MRHGGMVRAVLGLALVGLSSSCVDVNGSLSIVQAQVPDTAEGKCVVPSTRTETRVAQGTLDVALDRSYPYLLFALVTNRLPSLVDEGGIENNRIDVTASEVTIESPPGVNVPWPANCPAQYDYASDRVSLGPEGEATILVEAMRACHAATIRNMFLANQLPGGPDADVRFRAIVRAKGRHGGTHLESDRFEFPIRVCFGCLQTGYTAADFAPFEFPNIPLCSNLSSNPYKGYACNPGQDVGPVLCCARDAERTMIECPGTPRAQDSVP